MKNKYLKYLPYLIIINTILSIGSWSKISIGNTFFDWTINISIIVIIINYYYQYFAPPNKRDYHIVYFYFLWVIICSLRGVIIAEDYWEWKQLIYGSITLSLPAFVYIFSNPIILKLVLNKWIYLALPLFLVFIWFISTDSYQFYLGPVLFLSTFLVAFNRKWKLLFLLLLFLMIFIDFGARSQILKSIMAIVLTTTLYYSEYIKIQVLKFIHGFLYILPIILLFTSLSNIFNPFEELSKNEGKFVQSKSIDGKVIISDFSADTRTGIYYEVIESAVKNNYILWGRTPARGNDSQLFGTIRQEILKSGKLERHSNEIGLLNVFTWLGLVGLTLYSFIYLKSSYLAVYKSNNIYIKVLGVFIAFRFMYGWIEDFNRFDIMNISLWMMIAMGFSQKFRGMTNIEFKIWIRQVFH